jgi:hypothetical protein
MEPSDRNKELPSENRESEMPCDQPQGLGSEGEQIATPDPPKQRPSQTKEGEGTDNSQVSPSEGSPKGPPSKESSEIQQILARFVAAIQEGNESVRH